MTRSLLTAAFAATLALSSARADGDKPKPAAEGDKKPTVRDGEKPKTGPKDAPGGKRRRTVGLVAAVDTAAKTLTVTQMGEGGLRQQVVGLTDDAVITIDRQPAKLADLPKGMFVEAFLAPGGGGKDGDKVAFKAAEVNVQVAKFTWIVKEANSTAVTLVGGGPDDKTPDRVVKLAPGAKIVIDGKDAKPADLQAGDRAMFVMTADKTAAVSVTVNTPGGGDKK